MQVLSEFRAGLIDKVQNGAVLPVCFQESDGSCHSICYFNGLHGIDLRRGVGLFGFG